MASPRGKNLALLGVGVSRPDRNLRSIRRHSVRLPAGRHGLIYKDSNLLLAASVRQTETDDCLVTHISSQLFGDRFRQEATQFPLAGTQLL
jgi:hypothetical protein